MKSAFDADMLAQRLAELPAALRLAFAAACCERLYPQYLRFEAGHLGGASAHLRRALDAIWAVSRGEQLGRDDLDEFLRVCEAAAPDSDHTRSPFTSAAQDAALAICSVLDALATGEAEHLVHAARYTTDSIDLHVQELMQLDPMDPMRETEILEHPLMQQELERQNRDLEQLAALGAADAARLEAFQRRARMEDVFCEGAAG